MQQIKIINQHIINQHISNQKLKDLGWNVTISFNKGIQMLLYIIIYYYEFINGSLRY